MIALTTGDVDGVGLEIAIRAINHLHLPQQTQILLYCDHAFARSAYRRIERYPRYIAESPEHALRASKSLRTPGIWILGSSAPPPLWVEDAARLCLHKELLCLVTGPLSKPLIKQSGLKDLGHTEILRRITRAKTTYMSFWGPLMNVVLLTGHVPLRRVPSSLNRERVFEAFGLAQRLHRSFAKGRKYKPAALLGLNPHAGDQGLIGDEECTWMRPLVKETRNKMIGPLPPDSAFNPAIRKAVSFFLACYHDQGLIPFKLLHGFTQGVHVTLGLPFLRTSVDHGPAKELFGRNRADFGSMLSAIQMAANFAKRGEF